MSNINFDALKKFKKSSAERFEKIKEEASKSSAKFEKTVDERFWQPEVDKAGNGYAVIRFLYSPESDGLKPWVRYWDHAFKGPTGRWYIEKSLTTLGQSDPVSEVNSKLWATGTKENQELVRSRKRKLHYISNILVVSDSKHPENEGKVFLFRYGSKIFDKIKEIMSPEFPDQEACDPFNFYEGSNLKLKVRNVAGYRNYDASEFSGVAALGSDEEIGEIWAKTYSLSEFIAPDQFKSYDELKTKLAAVLGVSKDSDLSESQSNDAEEKDILDYAQASKKAKTIVEAVAKDNDSGDDVKVASDEDPDLNYFKGLVDDDEKDPF
jgi:hypothetical protein